MARWVKGIVKENESEQSIESNELPFINLQGFELQNLLTMLNNDQELATRLLLNFKENVKNIPNEIEAFIVAKNIDASQKLIHQIRGSAGNIGAMNLHAAAEFLETKCDIETFTLFKKAFEQAMVAIATLQLIQHASQPLQNMTLKH